MELIKAHTPRYPFDLHHAEHRESWYFKNSAECLAMRSMVKMILSPNWRHDCGWTVQGFGMLRCYLDPNKDFRLNIWDPSLAVPNVSTVHDHPWHFKSWIINGRFLNERFVEDYHNGNPFRFMKIMTGIEAGEQTREVSTIRLRRCDLERYATGDVYWQEASEIHQSLPEPATVTLNYRERVGTGDHARVFWRSGDWVDAKPRVAEDWEINRVCNRALDNWEIFSEQ